MLILTRCRLCYQQVLTESANVSICSCNSLLSAGIWHGRSFITAELVSWLEKCRSYGMIFICCSSPNFECSRKCISWCSYLEMHNNHTSSTCLPACLHAYDPSSLLPACLPTYRAAYYLPAYIPNNRPAYCMPPFISTDRPT